jgi:FkbM family methyltransferase
MIFFKEYQMNFKKRVIKSIRSRVFGKNYPKRDGFYSQDGQDIFLTQELFKDRGNGVFVDIGAYDGITFSNTYYLEKNLGWSGFCFEPNPDVFQQLRKNRTCQCLSYAIADFTGNAAFMKIDGHSQMLSGLIDKYNFDHLARIEEELKEHGGQKNEIGIVCARLDEILDDYGIQDIDYLNIDTEGAEFDILKTIDFEKRIYSVVSIENNYDDNRIAKYMNGKNFRLKAILKGDEFYLNKND